MSVQNKVIDIIAEQAVLDPADVTLDSTLESLGIDSLGLVESIFAIEEAFDITLEADDILNFGSFKKGFEILSKYDVQL